MEPHGGYICRLEGVDAATLVALAKKAIVDEGHQPNDAALVACLHPNGRLARLAFDAPFTYGRLGAQWYKSHVALAQHVSKTWPLQVHAYALDPTEGEWFCTFANGVKVKAAALQYAEAELSEDDVDDETDEVAFARLKEKWPLGVLGRQVGIPRKELETLPRGKTVWLPLEGHFLNSPLLQMFETLSSPRRVTRELRAASP